MNNPNSVFNSVFVQHFSNDFQTQITLNDSILYINKEKKNT